MILCRQRYCDLPIGEERTGGHKKPPITQNMILSALTLSNVIIIILSLLLWSTNWQRRGRVAIEEAPNYTVHWDLIHNLIDNLGGDQEIGLDAVDNWDAKKQGGYCIASYILWIESDWIPT